MSKPLPPNPTFLIIGAQKSATRWLRVNLGEHPDVYTAPEELHFFNRRSRVSRLGMTWYREQFVGWDGEPIIGESTPGYMIPRHNPEAVAKRIRRELPDVRLIAILRNPIDRAESALRHHMKRKRVPKRTRLVKAVKSRNPNIRRLELVDGGLYSESLRPYVKRFGENLLVLLHDDVVRNPVQVYKRALRHIGAEPSFVPPGLTDVVFSNRPPNEDGDLLTPQDRLKLWPYFSEDVRKLQRMIGRNLSMWNPHSGRNSQASLMRESAARS